MEVYKQLPWRGGRARSREGGREVPLEVERPGRLRKARKEDAALSELELRTGAGLAGRPLAPTGKAGFLGI